MSTPTALVILDGFGLNNNKEHNAIATAKTPTLDYLFANYPHTSLKASETAVGLPEDYIGNSEVGHQTIGSGRITKESLVVINEAIENNTFATLENIATHFKQLAHSSKSLHLVGLISDAGVHSSLKHVYALIRTAQLYHIKNIYIHAFLDGRDVAPKSAALYLKKLEDYCAKTNGCTIASLTGRFYAMDRNDNWERTKQAYENLVQEKPSSYTTWQQALKDYYAQGITDEFVPSTQLTQNSTLQNGDGLIFFNFRADRMRQLASCFADPNFTQFSLQPLTLAWCMTLTPYFATPYNEIFLFNEEPITNTLKDILQENHKSMYSIAETEKYAHVTYFFDGRRETQYPLETRVLVPSLKAITYKEHPAMSAAKITDSVIDSLNNNPKDFYLINYANADMVGHSGDFDATVKAIECLDKQIDVLYKAIVLERNGILYITGDHGKAEDMFDAHSSQPRTAHTINPVPFCMIQHILKGQSHELPLHTLSDIAPYILKYMGLRVPKEMIKD